MPQFNTHSQRNYCYGRQLQFAGLNALKTHMPGQYQTVADHCDRWKQFCVWARAMDIKEAHQIDYQVLKQYADYLRARVSGQGRPLSIATAQNRLSTCNVVLKCLRGNQGIRISPAKELQAKRTHVRTQPPKLSRITLSQIQQELSNKGFIRDSALLGLCRELGLRMREAALLDNCKALEQAHSHRVVRIELGTKGGRSKKNSQLTFSSRTVNSCDTSLHQSAHGCSPDSG